MNREQSDHHRSHRKLKARRQSTGAMPAAPAVEEFDPCRSQKRKEVLDVRSSRGQRAERHRMCWAVPQSEHKRTAEAACELEVPALDVLVGHSVAGQM